MATMGLGADEITALGLNDLRIHGAGKPRVLSLVSALLERTVRRNEKLLEASQAKDTITVFHGLRAPSLSIQQYIDRIFKYACCSPSCFVVAHIYINSFVRHMNLYLTSLNVHRLLITGVMLAAKFLDDMYFNNAYYARVGGVSTLELNKLEMKFLFGLDFRLHVSVEAFNEHCRMLQKEAVTVGSIEHPIQACYSTRTSSITQ